MKKLVLFFSLFAITAISFTSCSVFETVKEKASDKVKVVVEEKLKEAFIENEISVEGVDCMVEAENHALFIQSKVDDFLKIEREVAPVEGFKALSSMDSGIKSLLVMGCNIAVDSGIPYLFEKISTDNVCLKALGLTKAKTYGSLACSKI